jgi:hypothetical protein
MPISILMFLLARRFGAIADRIGPRLFMGLGPLVAAVGLLLLVRMDSHAPYASEVLPGIVLFALGIALTVAPLTAAVLGAVGGGHSGIASAVNNAVARVAGLVAVAAVGAAVAGTFSSDVATKLPHSLRALPATQRAAGRPFVTDAVGFAAPVRPGARRVLVSASVSSVRLAMGIAAALALFSGVLSLFGISNRPAGESRPPEAVRGHGAEAARAVGEPTQPAGAVLG